MYMIPPEVAYPRMRCPVLIWAVQPATRCPGLTWICHFPARHLSAAFATIHRVLHAPGNLPSLHSPPLRSLSASLRSSMVPSFTPSLLPSSPPSSFCVRLPFYAHPSGRPVPPVTPPPVFPRAHPSPTHPDTSRSLIPLKQTYT